MLRESGHTSIKRAELVVATMHDIDVGEPGGDINTYNAPRLPSGEFDLSRIIRAAEQRIEHDDVWVDIGGELTTLPLCEISYDGVESPHEVRALLGGLAVGQLVVMSRLSERFLVGPGLPFGAYAKRIAHPAQMNRDPTTRHIVTASGIAIPQAVPYQGGNLDVLDRRIFDDGVHELVNYLPEDMFVQVGHRLAQVPSGGKPADVNYDYELVAVTTLGDPVWKSKAKDLTNVPNGRQRQRLRIVHSEVLIEGLRCGAISPDDANGLVVALGVKRLPNGTQGNTFTKLGFFNRQTLEYIYRVVQI